MHHKIIKTTGYTKELLRHKDTSGKISPLTCYKHQNVGAKRDCQPCNMQIEKIYRGCDVHSCHTQINALSYNCQECETYTMPSSIEAKNKYKNALRLPFVQETFGQTNAMATNEFIHRVCPNLNLLGSSLIVDYKLSGEHFSASKTLRDSLEFCELENSFIGHNYSIPRGMSKRDFHNTIVFLGSVHDHAQDINIRNKILFAFRTLYREFISQSDNAPHFPENEVISYLSFQVLRDRLWGVASSIEPTSILSYSSKDNLHNLEYANLYRDVAQRLADHGSFSAESAIEHFPSKALLLRISKLLDSVGA